MGLPVVVALVTTVLLAVVSAEPREQLVFRLLSVYAAGPDQATAADRDNNDQISDTEFQQSLLFFTDEKRDRRVTQAEFVDGYRRQFGLPSELLVIMFDLLDDLNDDGNTRQGSSDVRDDRRNNEYFDVFSQMNAGRGLFGQNHQNKGDGILTSRDVNVRKFVGESKQSTKEEYRKSLMKWVAAAADRLYSINYQPHIPGNPWDMEFDYERWFTNVDRNNDSLISFKELSDEFRRYFADGRVRRTHWVSRNLKEYNDREWLSNVIFDYWDKNKDLRLDDLDVGLILKEADRNRDTRVTTIEFHRFMEKYNKRARRRLATPVRPVMYDCPSPWWQSFGCRPRVDATRAAMDMDDNFDGWITQGELRKRVSYYDRNGDGWSSRMEVMMVETMRYGVPGPVASVMFDVYDRNGDGRYDIRDVQHMLSNGRVLCFCDARRAVMDLVKLAEKFKGSPQAGGPAGSLRSAMRGQLQREWQWRQQAERLWHTIWGQGGPGGTCREGDCTGKDWRGGAWYSPFDWRQKNRVPENFLQWSYLHDVPRTVAAPPQGLGAGSGPFFPSGRSNWWHSPRWFQGDSWYEEGDSRGAPSARGGGVVGGFPSSSGPGARQFPSGAGDARVMPPTNFMPNPSKISSRPGSFPAAFNNLPLVPGYEFPGAGEENSAEEFWNRLLSGLDNDTTSNWDPVWVKSNMDFLKKIFGQTQNNFPPWSPAARNEAVNDKNEPWNWKSNPPSLSDIFRNSDTGTNRNPNAHTTLGGEKREDSFTGDDGARDSRGRGGSPISNRGRQLPSSSNSRFRRDASGASESDILVSPVPRPPSPTIKPQPSVDSSSSDYTDLDVNSTTSDSYDQSSDTNATESNNADQPINQNTTESDDQSVSSDKDNDEIKPSTEDAADEIGRSSAWLGRPYTDSSWLNYDRDPDCDAVDPWAGNELSESSMDPRFWEQTWQGQQDWSPVNEEWRSTNPIPMVWRDISQTLPYQGNSYSDRFPWWRTANSPDQWWRRPNPAANPGGFVAGGIADYPVPAEDMALYDQHRLMKRSTDHHEELKKDLANHKDKTDDAPENSETTKLSRMMGGYGGYWPQWWNMWNNYRYWPGSWNKWNWMWNNHYPFHFSEEVNRHPSDKEHIISKRSSHDTFEHQVSRMMGGYGGYWPQWWNIGNNYRSWPGSWNNWNRMWSSYYPFYFSQNDKKSQADKEHVRIKRSTDDKDKDQVSRMIGGYGGYWPQWWNNDFWPQQGNMWNNYRNWPGDWSNWNNRWMSKSYENVYRYYPFLSSPSGNPMNHHSRMKRAATEGDSQEVSRMMGGYGSYWPQWWNMGNNYRSWPGSWNNWNWMQSSFYPFYFSKDKKDQPDKEHILTKRSTDNTDEDRVSRMMGGYWPQWWNMRNNYRSWPGSWNWNSNRNWNSNWGWNSNNYGNFYRYYPFYFSANNMEMNQRFRMKRSANEDETQSEEVSRMMGGYGGYWPQWWNMGNNYRSWPGSWNNWNRMWNIHYPFYFSENDDKSQADKEHVREKRSTDDEDKDQVSRMMGGYGGYWPQWWNMWNNYRYWPGSWNNWNWNSNWGWNRNNYGNFYRYYPFYLSKQNIPMDHQVRMKRSASEDEEQREEVSRMMGEYNGFWPQRENSGFWPQRENSGFWPEVGNNGFFPQRENNGFWPQQMNMWNNNRNWPGDWSNWNNRWMSNSYENFYRYYPFLFAPSGNPMNYNGRMKRAATEGDSHQEVSRMMGGYGGYWPQWWNIGNNYRSWPGSWNNWNWMWSSYYPFYFSQNDEKSQADKEHVREKRSSGDEDKDQVSRLMGGYRNYWPQWWNMWNNYRSWPGSWNNWNWNSNWDWNRNNYGNFYRYYPFYLSKQNIPMDHQVRMKRSASEDEEQREEVSRMMDGYNGFWPQRENSGFWAQRGNNGFWPQRENNGFWPQQGNMWNYNRNWPGDWSNWNNRWMSNSYENFYRYYPFLSASSGNPMNHHSRMKRAATEGDYQEVSRMMGGYGGYWPQWWNMGNNYRSWPGSWNKWNWMWSSYNPFFFFSQNDEKSQADKEHVREKRSTDDKDKDQVSRMMGGYGGYWPQWWNNYISWPGSWNWNRNINWNNNWGWNRFHPFYVSKEDKDQSDMEHILTKRSTDNTDEDQVSRMMGGYGGYWPQWWNMGNNYRSWPGSWKNWNWMWINQYPFYFSEEDNIYPPDKQHIISKRSSNTNDEDRVSRMMGGYWPQWWNMWNNYKSWPGSWNNWNWMWNINYPFYFSQNDDKSQANMEHVRKKRSTDDEDKDQVSRMMGGYWPQWWNMGNKYRSWPGSWNNWNWNSNWGWNRNNYGSFYRYYPFYFSKHDIPMNHQVRMKRSASEDEEQSEEVSRMMGEYNGFWPQSENSGFLPQSESSGFWPPRGNNGFWPQQGNNGFWPQRGNNDYWPQQGNNGFWPQRGNNDFWPQTGNNDFWPQQGNMWNNYRYWPRSWNNWNWMWGSDGWNFPFFAKENPNQADSGSKVHVITKRDVVPSPPSPQNDQMGTGQWNFGHGWNNEDMMGQETMWNNPGQWPQWMWNFFNHIFPYFLKEEHNASDKEDIIVKRSTDKTGNEQVSRMMGGYGGYWPQWWNMWNNYRSWPGSWNNWNWMWNNHYPFYFSKNDKEAKSDKEHILRKRSTGSNDDEEVSRMIGGYWPQWWNMGNNYGYWPGSWNNWNWNTNWGWSWNNNENFYRYYPFYFSKQDMPMDRQVRMKRSVSEDEEQSEEVSRMMGGYNGFWPQRENSGFWPQTGNNGFWPQQGNIWNYNRNWPGDWSNYNNRWMSTSYENVYRYYPFLSSPSGNPMNHHSRMKRAATEGDSQEVSRIMGGYGGYWPQWWNMGNNYRYWPESWVFGNSNWMWNNNNRYSHNYYPFYVFSEHNNGGPNMRMKRSSGENAEDENVSRMMGGYGGYWPQWWNMWNNYRYWPGSWNKWNRMWNNHYPFYFSKDESKDQSHKEDVREKRSTDNADEDQVSRMMGGYWPQWWNMRNNYRSWPGFWNNWNWNSNWGWNRNNYGNFYHYYPFYFSKQDIPMDRQVRMKRSASEDEEQSDEVSRMMGGHNGFWPQTGNNGLWPQRGNNGLWPQRENSGFWPQQGNMWNNYRNWPGDWSNWNNRWISHSYENFYRYYPFLSSPSGNPMNHHSRMKRAATEGDSQEVSRMMGGYGGYWPQWWNMGNNYRYWPSSWNNWNWMWNRHYPFYFSKEHSDQSNTEHTRRKRSSDNTDDDQVSRMMGGYGGYWPQWWNMGNNYRSWPESWNNWNWMWNNHYPFYFSKEESKDQPDKEDVREKRSTDNIDGDRVSRMMGGHWPQWWNMGNNYRSWPGSWNWNNNWGWNSNNYGNVYRYYPFYFSKNNMQMNQRFRMKRSANEDETQSEEVSRMMGGYGGYWPQWWNMGNNYRSWPGSWNNWNWMWNRHYPFYFSQNDDKSQADKEHVREKRSTDDEDKDQVSRMMGGYGGYWPQWWNVWNNYRYWPGWNWGSNRNSNNNWGWSRFNSGFPFNSYYHFPNSQSRNSFHTVRKRNADESDKKEEKVANMMDGYNHPYWPESQNMWQNYRYQPYNWDNRPNWGNQWNGNNWMWGGGNRGQFSPSSFFYQQKMDPGFPPTSGYQNDRWNAGNNVDGFPPSFYPFAFSQNGDDVSDDVSKKREKRSSEEVVSKNKTVENSTDASINDTGSAPEPGVARQMAGYDGSSGNPYQRQWRRLYRSYLNSRPRYWSGSPYYDAYGDTYYTFYRRWYSNRYGRHYYIRYIVPRRVYQQWFRQMWNRMWGQNRGTWDKNNYDTAWHDYASRYSPFSYSWGDSAPAPDPDIRQQKNNEAASEEEQTEAGDQTANTEEKRTKRSMGYMSYGSGNPYQHGNMFGSMYNSPTWWNYNMHSYNYWPWWNSFMYTRMPGQGNGNNGMWSNYNSRPFMYSREQGPFNENTKQNIDENASGVEGNEASTSADSSRSKRSTEDQSGDDDSPNEEVSRWLRVPDQFHNQPIWQQNSWGRQMPRWMRRNHREGFNTFFPGFMNKNNWNPSFMPTNRFNPHINHNMNWDSLNNFGPFSFSESGGEAEKQTSHERQERSADEAVPTQFSADGADPEVSRWMTGYPSTPPVTSMVYPWPVGMGQGWQYQGYNSHSQWRMWNGWGQGKSLNNWNAAHSTTFPSFPFAFTSGDGATTTEKIRQKRNSEKSADAQKEDSEEASKDDPEVSRMGRGFGWTRFYPMGSKKHGPDIFMDRQLKRYAWPVFDSAVYRPWGSNWRGRSQFPSWNQNQFYPRWNQYQNTPYGGWSGNGRMRNANNWNDFNNKYVDESVFDPLSSYYFSKKDTSKTDSNEKLEKNAADKPETDSKTATSQEEQGRSKRSAVTLAKLLSKKQEGQDGKQQEITFQTMLKPNRRFVKRNVPYKLKRFSPEAAARLENRFQKRSPASSGPGPEDDKSPSELEVAPKMAMRATAPARDQSARDREWGPPRGAGFSPDPSSSPKLPDRNEIPNPAFNPGQGSGQAPGGSGQGFDPLRNFGGGPDDWHWDQPEWSGNLNWAGKQDPVSGDGGQGSRDRSQGQDRDGSITTTTSNADGEPSSNVPGDGSILNGDDKNRLSNYNYIDVNNPNYWNQFYNPSSFNASTGGPLGNTTQWNNWFGLWAYGPNFWDDMNDLDLWDAPWGSGSWGMGPGGDRWNDNNWWQGDPETGFSSGLPVEMGWEAYWLDDCDRHWNSRDSGYRPWNPQDWWNPPAWFADVAYSDVWPDNTPDWECRECFPPYAVFPLTRPYQGSFRPSRYNLRAPLVSGVRPTSRYPDYRSPRFFYRPLMGPRGSSSSGGPWYKSFPGYPWDPNGKAQWRRRGFPWWGWNPNSFWNPWRYRIQYRNNDLGPKVSRTRRSAAPPHPLQHAHQHLSSVVHPTSATVLKVAPTTATIRTNPVIDNTPSLPASPFNTQGPQGPSLYDRPTPGEGSGGGSDPSNPSGWTRGLPWWDKNNWHVAPAEYNDHNGRFPDQSHMGHPPKVFGGPAGGGGNFPPAGLEGARNFPPTGMGGPQSFPTGMDGARNFPTGMDGARNFPTGMDGPQNFPTGMGGPQNFPTGMDGPQNFPTGMGGPQNFPTGMDGPQNFPTGMDGPQNFPTGMDGPQNFPTGMDGPQNFPTGMDGPQNFPTGMGGTRNFPTGMDGPQNFPTGMGGTRNFPTGMDGPQNFPTGMDGPQNFPTRMGGTRNFPTGPEGPRNFLPRPEGPRNFLPRPEGPRNFLPRPAGPRRFPTGLGGPQHFAAGMGQGRGAGSYWRPPLIPRHTDSGPASPTAPWWGRGGGGGGGGNPFFRRPPGFHPGPLRQAGVQPAGDIEEDRVRRSPPVTPPPTPWSPSPCGKNNYYFPGGRGHDDHSPGTSGHQGNNKAGPTGGNN